MNKKSPFLFTLHHFACQSSELTLPVNDECAKKTGMLPEKFDNLKKVYFHTEKNFLFNKKTYFLSGASSETRMPSCQRSAFGENF